MFRSWKTPGFCASLAQLPGPVQAAAQLLPLTHAVGLVPEGAAPDAYEWTYSPGDWLILCTDGLLDSGLAAEEIGSTLVNAESAEDALNTLCKKILRMMTTLRAKPDNLSVVAIHAL